MEKHQQENAERRPDSPGHGTRGSRHGEPCITPGQKMGARPGSSASGFGYRDTAGLKYIPAAAAAAVVARPFIRGKPDSSWPAVVMGLPRMSLIPCGVPPDSCELRPDSGGALKPAGLCCSAYGNRDVFISVMLCSAASGVLPRTKALCRLASICPTANIGGHEPPDPRGLETGRTESRGGGTPVSHGDPGEAETGREANEVKSPAKAPNASPRAGVGASALVQCAGSAGSGPLCCGFGWDH